MSASRAVYPSCTAVAAVPTDEFSTPPGSAWTPTHRLHTEDGMALDLFVGVPVADYAAAFPWYERFFGREPSFLPNDVEAVWEVAEHRYVYIVEDRERAGNALALTFVDDLDSRVAEVAGRGIEPARQETYEGGVTKVIYRDADGNEISLGGGAG
ncbi:VOC family protein [Streptomyces marispadix]|uniref:VOC family protein n=1 Tax=Streptomyces marispadix TaxID=2922868 RepID=A0ABS9SSK5_9ACTN|nr:VOC family protein [Streptomyces marispadix]MCH6159036.1 VOC family protein [Streptomyces marispadix]